MNVRDSLQKGDENDAAEVEHFSIEPDVHTVCSAAQPSLNEDVFYKFVRFSIFCAAVPACALACLALATAQLGTVGARQSGILYATYTLFSLLGMTTLIVQKIGSRDTVILGQVLFGIYIALFWIASILMHTSTSAAEVSAWIGAGLGGIGASILWTAQGIYFAESTHAYCDQSGRTLEESTSLLAGVFAFCFLMEETCLDILATILVKAGVPWNVVFMTYTCVTFISIVSMTSVQAYPRHEVENGVLCRQGIFSKASGAVNLLITDSRTKYMIGFNAAFGFAGAYLNSFISGQVVPTVFNDASFVGILVAIHGVTAAFASLCYARMSSKSPAIFIGSLAFASVAVPFLIQRNIEKYWGWSHLMFIYVLHGVGRASFEGPLKAVFADIFPRDTDAAFTNITLQNGAAGSFAYFLVSRLACEPRTTSVESFCFAYQDGSYHNVGILGCIVIGTSVASILGYARVRSLSKPDRLLDYTRPERMLAFDHGSELYTRDVSLEEEGQEERDLPEIT